MTGTTIKHSNFEKVGSIVDSIIAKQADPKKCEFCGKEYIKADINVLGRKSTVFCVPCDCIDKENQKKEESAAKERLREKFQKANIGKRYIGMTLEKLEKMKTEHVADAFQYVEKFNPESGNSVHMIGTFGNGKTSIGYATVSALLNKGFNCVAITWNDFISRCYNAKNFNTTETLQRVACPAPHGYLSFIDNFLFFTNSNNISSFSGRNKQLISPYPLSCRPVSEYAPNNLKSSPGSLLFLIVSNISLFS